MSVLTSWAMRRPRGVRRRAQLRLRRRAAMRRAPTRQSAAGRTGSQCATAQAAGSGHELYQDLVSVP